MKRRIQSLHRTSSSRQNPLSKSKSPPPPLPLTATNATAAATILTAEELSSIHSITRRLCESNRLDSAIRLLSVSLLASPSSSLPIPTLINSLTSSPSPSPHSFSLLTSLRHTSPLSLPSVSSLLLSSLLSKRRHADAWRVLAWFLKGEEDSPCRPSQEMYVAALRGFCSGGRGREGVRVAREMVRDAVAVADEERAMLRRCLLREARVDAAAEVDAAVAAGDGDVLDRIVREWEE